MSTYVVSFEELMWGALLVAITMVIHGTGMFAILWFTESLKERFAPWKASWAVSAWSFSRAC